jgi:hypothetical protein
LPQNVCTGELLYQALQHFVGKHPEMADNPVTGGDWLHTDGGKLSWVKVLNVGHMVARDQPFLINEMSPCLV